ncbi:putative pectin lyase F [Paramyrothecium foliicola]|nr:putative pectin lyase F [Paramyrothecium foliicola]
MYFTSSLAAVISVLAASTNAQVKGTPYGFARGVTGGGSATVQTPTSAAQLTSWLSDGTPRVINIDREWDFTGTTASGAGCDRKSCSANNGGQLYLGTLSCGGSDNVATTVTYDVAGTQPLRVGSNKSIISNNRRGVIKGKGLQLVDGAKNVIIQGIELKQINPKVVWGGDALDFRGNNDGVWVDHCKFSTTGRMFIVTHFAPTRATISNNEFDGRTSSSASCNGNHYWSMMFYAAGDRITLDRNYFHDLSGRAPKLGDGKAQGTFQATNNYFANMKGHAFDIYNQASTLIEGNVFSSVATPFTTTSAGANAVFNSVGTSVSNCASYLGRNCVANSLSGSGAWPGKTGAAPLTAFQNARTYLVNPVAASQVASLVLANAGPSKL